ESSAAGALIEQALRVCLERERWQLYPPAAIGFSAAWHKEYAFWHAPERTPSERASKLAAAIGGCLATLSGERALRALEDLESLGPAVTKTSSLERSILLLIGVQERPNEVVEKAVDLIASTRDPLWFSPLCGVLTTTFGEAAAGLVGKSMVALNQVASSLSHPLPMVRRLAIERAAEEGESVVPILIDALADVDRNVRLAAIRELGRVGSRQAFEHLKLIAGSGKGADRAAAIQAIGGIGGADALALLQDALRADDAALKLAAIAGMAELGTSEAVDALLVELHLESVPNDLRAAALAGLRRIGGEPVRVKMRSLLHGDKPELRADAALLLGHLLDNEATPVLIPLLDQPERRTDARAALTKLFVEDLGEDPFRYEVLAKEGRPFEELYLRATGLSGSLSPAELRGPGAKRDVVVPALIERLMDSRWAVREDADVLLKELLGVHVDPLLKEATREQLQARQRFWHDRAGK
ncbi:MAG: HEAT repeat domain-containing protein, partial [Planctomycetota bacterium]